MHFPWVETRGGSGSQRGDNVNTDGFDVVDKVDSFPLALIERMDVTERQLYLVFLSEIVCL